MKKHTLKHILSLTLAAALFLSLAACSGESTSKPGGEDIPAQSSTPAASNAPQDSAPPAGGEGYRVAIVQQMDHASLDEIRRAIEAELEAKAEELGVAIEYRDFNGQGDATVLNQIGSQVVADGYDVIIPIASLAAQCMVTAAEDAEIPVVYAAISDPEAAGVTGLPNVTGTSDALNTTFILDMMLAQNPEVKTVGLLYSLSEPNSTKPIADAKAYLEEKGISYIEGTGNTSDEVIAAVTNMLDRVDAVFTPTDNVVMATELATAELFIEAGVPHYTGADSFVRNGAFTTCGVNYTELGAYTADMALEVLQTGQTPEYHVMEGGIITVNTETAQALGIDYSVFQDMASTVSEVVTTEE